MDGYMLRTFVDVREVSTKTIYGFQNSAPVRAIQGLDRFCIKILDGLLVAAAYAVFGAGVAVEGIYRLGDAHLRGSHGSQRIEISARLLLQSRCRVLHGTVSTLFHLVIPVVGLFHMA